MIASRTVWTLLAALAATRLADAQALERVSVDSAGVEGDRGSYASAISGDGRLVAFESDASNLVAGDTNGVSDIFVHDVVTGVTERVSVDSSGGEGDGYSAQPALSADGRFVAFLSFASKLVAGDSNAMEDVFVHDRVTGATVRASVDSAGGESNDYSAAPSLSADGRFVAFSSFASNLVAGDVNGTSDAFVHDLATGSTVRVSVDSAGGEGNFYSYLYTGSISADGQLVVFESGSSNLVAGDTNGTRDVFVHDRTTGATRRVSVDSSGAQGNSESELATISGDGKVVAFASYASNLVPGDLNSSFDVFVHDLASGATELVGVDSSGVEGNFGSDAPSISSDGRIVAFESASTNLVAHDKNQQWDIFLRDRAAGTTERVSVTDLGVEGDSGSGGAALSSDGRTAAFSGDATNLVPNDDNDRSDVFVRIPCATLASWSNYGNGLPGTFGVPTFTARSNPVLGTTVVLDLENSSGLYSVALLFLGYQRADRLMSWGGHLLVDPVVTKLLGLPPTGNLVGGDLPAYASLCGLAVDLQAIELDPGAAKGVSFTPGLELVLGD